MKGKSFSNNYTKVPNELMETLYSKNLTQAEVKVLLLVARKTWGWQKPSDFISYSQFRKETGLSQPTLVKTLKNLRVVKFVNLVKRGSVKGDCNEWKIDTNNIPQKVVNLLNLHLIDTKNLVKQLNHTKETITKEREPSSNNGMDYLLTIPIPDLEEFTGRYSCTKDQVIAKGEALYNWCIAKGEARKNYKAFLVQALLKDFGKKEEGGYKDAKTFKYIS